MRDFYRTHYTQAGMVLGLAGGFPADFPKKVEADFARLPAGKADHKKFDHPKVDHGMRIEIMGETAHVGPTAMALRRNALVAASHVAVAIDDIGWRYAHAEGKTTAARLDLWPNLPGIISERATLFCDLRHPDPAQLNQMVADIETALPDCARRGQCGVAIAERWGFGVMAFDAELIALIREAAAELGHPTMDVKSEAGHDSYNLATMCPSAMIFTPCKGGISHNEAEDTTLEDTLPGANVLLRAVIARANR